MWSKNKEDIQNLKHEMESLRRRVSALESDKDSRKAVLKNEKIINIFSHNYNDINFRALKNADDLMMLIAEKSGSNLVCAYPRCSCRQIYEDSPCFKVYIRDFEYFSENSVDSRLLKNEGIEVLIRNIYNRYAITVLFSWEENKIMVELKHTNGDYFPTGGIIAQYIYPENTDVGVLYDGILCLLEKQKTMANIHYQDRL